jgi:hypothetical protein
MPERRRKVCDPKISCPKKLYLLQQYATNLTLRSQELHDYVELVNTMTEGELMALAKKRLEDSMERVRDACKRYTDHVHEHGCSVLARLAGAA